MLYTLTRGSGADGDLPKGYLTLGDTSTLGSGCKDLDGAVVFTCREAARDAASSEPAGMGWRVLELPPPAVVELLANCSAAGARQVILNPGSDYNNGEQVCLPVPTLCAIASEAVVDALLESAPENPPSNQKESEINDQVAILNCQHCGAVAHIELSDTLPYCCGSPMTPAAREQRENLVSQTHA